MWTQELRLLGKCERCITPRARQTTDRCVRYANTLLVNLNNRIYFRDHQPPGVGDSADFMPSDRVCATAQTSLRFAIPEPDSFQLHTITPTVDLGIGEGDDTMVNSTLVSSISRYSCLFHTNISGWLRFTFQSRATKCHLYPDDPESIVDSFPPTHCQ